MTTASVDTSEDYVFPLSYQQERMWFMAQLEPDNPAYHLTVAAAIRGNLDVAALSQALDDVVARHEALRTRYERGTPVQVVSVSWRPSPLLIDLQGIDAGRVEALTREIAVAVARRPLDPFAGPVLRAALVRRGIDDHVLVLVVHHIAADGWSVGLLLSDLSAAYTARLAGMDPRLPDPTVQYGDYALWQRDEFGEQVLVEESAKRAEELATAPSALALPTDRPRSTARPTGARIGRTLQADLVQGLERLARAQRATPFMVVLAAYALVLARMAGQRGVVVGTPMAGRTRSETRSTIGCFIDVVPIRVDLSGVLTVGELIEEARQASLAAFSYADLPFERLVARLAPQRDLSRAPVFQAMLSFDGTAEPVLGLPGLEVEPVALDPGVAKYDLTVDTERRGDQLVLTLEYRSDLFDAVTAERVLTRLEQTLLGLVGADPQQPVDTLALADPAERAWLAAVGSGPSSAPAFDTVVDAVARSVAQRWGAAAVLDASDGLQWTYAELANQAAFVRASLAAAGVRRGDLVGVLLPRSPVVLATILGIWETGAAYLPLDPQAPPQRTRQTVEDSGIRTVVSSAGVDVVALGLTGLRIVDLDAAAGAGSPAGAAFPGDVAYVLYTSGSTGRAKGVTVGHAGVANLLDAVVAASPGFTSQDRMLAVTTITFDISVLELFAPLVAGGEVVVATDEQARDPFQLIDAIERYRPTVVQATPTMWRMLLDAGWKATYPIRVMVGGEALPADLATRLCRAGHEVWNLYGPTETTIWSTAGRITNPSSPHLGRPLAQTRVEVLDPAGRPAPAGAIGEVFIAGAGVAHGYLGRPGQTAERFVPCPTGSGARRYRTGDLARWRSDGTLAFCGRADDQVKIRGHRVELREIEHLLTEHPAVAAAVARADSGEAGDVSVVAYLKRHAEVPLDPAEVIRSLRQQAPAHLVPNRIVVLDDLPRTPNGKVDRTALAALDPGTDDGADAAWSEPADGLEVAVLDCFRAALGAPSLSMVDDFFARGGTSLMAVRLVAEIEAVLGIRLPLRDLFVASTPSAVAALLRRPTSLPADVVVGAVRSDAWSAGQVLVLGADMGLGVALVERLVATGVDVTCALPAPDDATAEQRWHALAGTGAAPARPRVVSIDPDSERLGLDKHRYIQLARSVGAVYCLDQPSEPAQSRSVLLGAVRLAAVAGSSLHLVNAIDRSAAVDGAVPERVGTDGPETIMVDAATRGLPITIVRVDELLPARDAPGDDLRSPILATMLRTGSYPDVPELEIRPLTCDEAARMLVDVTRHPGADGRVVHLVNPTPIRLRDAVALLAQAGRNLRAVPADAWLAELADPGLARALRARYGAITGRLDRPEVQVDAGPALLGRDFAFGGLTSGYLETLLENWKVVAP